MCHIIFTFYKCSHIDVSDDAKHFPPCICNSVRATRQLPRACNACIRYSASSFHTKHKRMVEMQIERFRRLGINWAETEKFVPQWRRIVGLGIKVARDWAESSDDEDNKIAIDEKKEIEILGTIEEESRIQNYVGVVETKFDAKV
ncbi:hypothetical protein ABW20_dc0109494 [Dactylellina cionopaga]|nr:hypothetical protein ABW20_dc0109494 [Dactylellina cionopaga]